MVSICEARDLMGDDPNEDDFDMWQKCEHDAQWMVYLADLSVLSVLCACHAGIAVHIDCAPDADCECTSASWDVCIMELPKLVANHG